VYRHAPTAGAYGLVRESMKQGPVAMVVGLLVLGTTVYLGHQTIGSCTLGVHGTSATLTVSGWAHQSACQHLIKSNPWGIWEDVSNEPPSGDSTCEVRRDHRRYFVRDGGLPAFAMGRSICTAMSGPDFWEWRDNGQRRGVR